MQTLNIWSLRFRIKPSSPVTVQKLAIVHLKLLDMTNLINQTLSPLMMFSFGISFALFCVFIFTVVVFPFQFFATFALFGISNVALKIHLFGTMLTVLWICETTASEQNKVINFLFQILLHSNNEQQKETVSFHLSDTIKLNKLFFR